MSIPFNELKEHHEKTFEEMLEELKRMLDEAPQEVFDDVPF